MSLTESTTDGTLKSIKVVFGSKNWTPQVLAYDDDGFLLWGEVRANHHSPAYMDAIADVRLGGQ